MKKIIFIGLIFCSITSMAQNDPQKIVDEFFKLYKDKGANSAVDYIFSTNKWMNQSQDQLDNVKFKLNSNIKLIGDYAGFNLISKKTLGEHLIFYTYMVRYDRQPLRFSLLFYKPTTDWRLLNFSYDDNMDEELQEASKAFRLKENFDN